MPTNASRILTSFNSSSVKVTRVDELLEAVHQPTISFINVEGLLSDVPGFRLPPHQEIRGTSGEESGLKFRDGDDGIELSSDNSVSCLTLVTSPDRCSIWNDGSVPDFGTLYLNQLRTIGRVQVLARNQVRGDTSKCAT